MFWVLIMCTVLTGCGQYGALYLPTADKTKENAVKMPENAPDIAVQVNRETPP